MEEINFDYDDIPDFILDVIPEELQLENVPVVKTKKKKVVRNYINNNDFYNAIVDYKNSCSEAVTAGKSKPRIPNYIGECFIKLSENLAKRPNFFGYSYRDEMISDGIENCLRYIENFNPEKTKNPFAYFTQILWWCFVRRIKKEKTQQYIKYKATENFGILDTAELLELGDGNIKQLEVYDNMYDYIKKYEETELKKKESSVKEKKIKVSGVELFLED